MIPPFDCMIRTGASELASLTRLHEGIGVRLHDGAEAGVDYGRAGALVLADFGQYVHGQRHEYSRQHPTQFLANGPLMVGIAVRMKEANRHGLCPFLKYDVDRSVEGVHVEREQDFAVRADPLRHLQPQVAVHQGFRGSVEQAVQGRHAHPS